jgi:hypothetical protein
LERYVITKRGRGTPAVALIPIGKMDIQSRRYALGGRQRTAGAETTPTLSQAVRDLLSDAEDSYRGDRLNQHNPIEDQTPDGQDSAQARWVSDSCRFHRAFAKALSRGERVAHDGVLISRRGSGEGFLPEHPTDPSPVTLRLMKAA